MSAFASTLTNSPLSSAVHTVLTPSSDFFNEIVVFLTGNECKKCMCTNRSWLGFFINNECIWRRECLRLQYSRGSRSRDARSWLQVYSSMQCIKCHDAGSITLNIPIVKARPTLCIKCFLFIRSYKRYNERLKNCLRHLNNDWLPYRESILNAVPTGGKKVKRPNTSDADFDGAFMNDYLVNTIS